MGVICDIIKDFLCEYKSVRFIRVRDPKLAATYRVTMALVLVYVIVFTIIMDKGYQTTDEVTGTTSAKLKGSGSVGNDSNFIINGTVSFNFTNQVFELIPLDAMDLVRPAMEENAFFLTTAMTVTPNQTQEICDGNPNEAPDCNSSYTDPCKEEFYAWDSQGSYPSLPS